MRGQRSHGAAGFALVCPAAIGVYWGKSTVVVPKKIFIELAEEVLPHEPPLFIWVDFRVGRDGETSSYGFAHGMEALGYMEFEARAAPEPPGQLRERLLSLARYVIKDDGRIRDGDTVGQDAHEKIRVSYAASAFGHEGRVMRLTYESVPRKKPWWQLV